jgi:hypothetical protein
MYTIIPESWFEKTSEEEKEAFIRFFSTLSDSIEHEHFDPQDQDGFNSFIKEIKEVDQFYSSIGGIAGYYQKVMGLLEGKNETSKGRLFPPPHWDIREIDPKYILYGLTSLPLIGEIYPLGGAGDRLSLLCDSTKEPLPAACLPYLGRNLLECLVRDVQGKESLFFKLFGKSIVTPIALMTSDEKDNHGHIVRLLEEGEWFHRPKSHFFLFKQPQAPLISQEGGWMFTAPWKLAMKPGGHGLLWKLAREKGVFAWLERHNRSKVLVRQINNPIAGLDFSLLAFVGIGVMEDKGFGYLSCPRRVGAPEGVNLLVEEEGTLRLTAVEYTDFSRFEIVDEPVKPGSAYSKFPSNTNLLFGDLSTVKALSHENPFPGLILNPKTKVQTFSRRGPDVIEKIGGRLETLMQSIGDLIRAKQGTEELKSFVAFNERQKTISPTKKSYEAGRGIEDTPEGAFYDHLVLMERLLRDYCQFDVPTMPFAAEYDLKNPPFLFSYHPALGPPFQLIAQKIMKGKFHPGAEVELEIGEVALRGVEVKGSLIIHAKRPLGTLSSEGLLAYSHAIGKCLLEEVIVDNLGIDYSEENRFWKGEVKRRESLEIVLEGDSFFEARGVKFEGGEKIIVPDGWHYRITPQGLERKPLKNGLPLFSYEVGKCGEIIARLEQLEG